MTTGGSTPASPRTARTGCILLALFVVDAIVHLTGQLLDWPVLLGVTQVLLVPPLLGYAIGAGMWPLGRPFVLGLVFCWLGDTLPRLVDPSSKFVLMVACFSVAQVAFIVWFWRERRVALDPARRIVWVAYLVLLVVFMMLCARGAGSLLPLLLAYGICLTVMAILATGCGVLTGIGGALFFVSDCWLALRTFGPGLADVPLGNFLVMATYIPSLLLLTAGAVREFHLPRPESDASPG